MKDKGKGTIRIGARRKRRRNQEIRKVLDGKLIFFILHFIKLYICVI